MARNSSLIELRKPIGLLAIGIILSFCEKLTISWNESFGLTLFVESWLLKLLFFVHASHQLKRVLALIQGS